MQQSRWILASALAPFLLLSCGNSPIVPAPPSKEAAVSTAITATTATNDASNVTYTVTYTGTHQFFRVYIDTDRAAGTGFAYGGMGAEFLLENGSLYRYTGSGTDWSWASGGAVTYANPSGQVTWTVARATLGLTSACSAAANLLFDIDDGVAPILQEVLTPAATCAAATTATTSTATATTATATVTASSTGGISNARASNDATNVQYSFSFTGTPAYWRAYVDTDNSASTGYANGGIGAEFLVEGSGVYQYVGPGWNWTAVGSATFSSSGGTASWSVARALMGETAACGERSTLAFETEDSAGHLGSAGPLSQTFTNAASCTTAGAGGSTPATSTGGTTATTPTATGGTTAKGGTTGTTATGGTTGTSATGGTTGTTTAAAHTQVVFVIAMENEPESSIYGSSSAPYINQLMAQYAHTNAFTDPLPDGIPSEPHYVWMEAGTNAFSDHTFTDDSDPDAGNSTASTAHLTAQMMAASTPVSWLSFPEGMTTSGSGACPISSSGFYAAKHDPFVFFQDIAGRTPSATSSVCTAHHRAYTTSSFAQAMSQGTIAQYNFITPNLCNDMHGASGCPGSSDVIAAGDSWLSTNLPPIIQYANAHNGVIFVVWDEPEGGSPLIPFLAIGPHVKAGYTSPTSVTHSALVKTVEKIFGLPLLPAVASANDFGDSVPVRVLPVRANGPSVPAAAVVSAAGGLTFCGTMAPQKGTRDPDPDGGGEGLRTVVVALAANLGIAAAKLIAALLTRSSAMLAEVFHSSADTGNQVLLLVANRRAGRPPEPGYPLGHGREAYFWALIASLGMFFTGALLSVREGIEELVHPTRVASVPIALIVLGVSFCLDGLSLLRAFRQLRREAATLDRQFLEHLDITSDPVARAVFAEDAVALAGNVLAAGGIALHALTGSAVPDAVAALLIGASLGVVALDLARRNRDFLIGREAAPRIRSRLTDLIGRQDGVARVGELVVTYVGPRRLWVVARIDVDRALTGTAIHGLVNRVESTLHREVPAVVRVDIVPQAAG